MSKEHALYACTWNEPGGTQAAQSILCFIESVGIAVEFRSIDGSSLLDRIAVRRGALCVDPAIPAYPGDLLHEAGHIAVTPPELRASLGEIAADGGEEMAAIAWSVAAARACGVSLDVLFHPAGYKGGAAELAADWEAGQPFGVSLLAWYGMTTVQDFPVMSRWLR